MAISPVPIFDTVHAPLAHWAATRPDKIALDDGQTRLDFAALAQAVATQATSLRDSDAPAICWVDAVPEAAQQLIRFLSVISADRTAAVSDPDWPASVTTEIMERVADIACIANPQRNPQHNTQANPDSPFYIGFTSGSSGLPKGFRRNHGSWTSSFAICLETFGPGAADTILVPGRLSHSTFLFGALLGIWTGAGIRMQSRFSATAALDTLARGDARAMVAVPSQLILMLDLAQRRNLPAMPQVSLLMIGGAPWTRARTPELQALFPQARIVEFYGASETSFIAWTDSDSSLPDHVVGHPFSNVEVRIDSATPHTPGLIYVRSPMVFSDYVTLTGDQQSALLRDGDWLSVRDVGHIDQQGRLHLSGRQQRMLLVQGKNLFPEEVENLLATHPAVISASVQGVADPVRGAQVSALLQLRTPVSASALTAFCRERLEPYKIPRRFYLCEHWPLTPSGKSDHKALAQQLATGQLPAL